MPEGGSEHYKGGSIEPIELIEAQNINFHCANIIKYATRANYYALSNEGEVEEAMDKIVWYAQRFKVVYKDMMAPDK